MCLFQNGNCSNCLRLRFPVALRIVQAAKSVLKNSNLLRSNKWILLTTHHFQFVTIPSAAKEYADDKQFRQFGLCNDFDNSK